MRYSELRPGDSITWKSETDSSGVIKCFHANSIDPIGVIETTTGLMITRERVTYKLVSDQKIEIDK
jgi:hypothetical protein